MNALFDELASALDIFGVWMDGWSGNGCNYSFRL
jgi:hypothetical protein